MLKEDELLMINKILTVGVGKIFETLQPTKRQAYILYKWANKGYVWHVNTLCVVDKERLHTF